MGNQPSESRLLQKNMPSDSENSAASATSTEAYQATQYLIRRKMPPWLYYKLRTFSRQYPILFLPASRWRWARWREKYCSHDSSLEPAAPEPVVKDSKIVIEGFPRTGNTFAHIAFKFAQDQPIKIGHHTHAAAQVIAAAKMNIPTIVLLREPEKAIVSYLVGNFDPGLTIEQSLREYISFYSCILPYRDKYVVASFDEVTTDFGAVIRRVNQKFGTAFQEFEHTEENVQRCFDLIDQGYEVTFGDLSETVVSRPVESRKQLAEGLQDQFNSAALSKLRSRAVSLYEQLKRV